MPGGLLAPSMTFMSRIIDNRCQSLAVFYWDGFFYPHFLQLHSSLQLQFFSVFKKGYKKKNKLGGKLNSFCFLGICIPVGRWKYFLEFAVAPSLTTSCCDVSVSPFSVHFSLAACPHNYNPTQC